MAACTEGQRSAVVGLLSLYGSNDSSFTGGMKEGMLSSFPFNVVRKDGGVPFKSSLAPRSFLLNIVGVRSPNGKSIRAFFLQRNVLVLLSQYRFLRRSPNCDLSDLCTSLSVHHLSVHPSSCHVIHPSIHPNIPSVICHEGGCAKGGAQVAS